MTQTPNAVDRDKVVEQYAEFVNPYLARLMAFAGFGVECRAEGGYLYDEEGKAYLDFLGGYGVFSLGHRHPKVIARVKQQLDLQPLSGKVFFNPVQGELAARLAGLAPEGLQYSFFSNSGAEAVEAALKFARIASGRTEVVSTNGSYHGKTLGALSVTGKEKYRKPFEPLVPGAKFVPYGDVSALSAITELTAAFIVEPVQGEGGIVVPPDGYLTAARAACDKAGALLIVDEVQTGLGRTGYLFGCEHDGVRPDIMTLAKCLSGGVVPIGVTMGTPKVWEAVFAKNPLLHTSTFGGNELACAAALAALEVVEEEGLIEKSRRNGVLLQDRLRHHVGSHPLIAEVRGRGLMVGVEFVMDEVGEVCIAQMTMRGVVAAYTLNSPRVIRFEPPLNVTEDQIERAARVFAEAVEATQLLLNDAM